MDFEFSVVVCTNPSTYFFPLLCYAKYNDHLLAHQVLAIYKHRYQLMLRDIPLFKFLNTLLML
jgi:hypothetical protein